MKRFESAGSPSPRSTMLPCEHTVGAHGAVAQHVGAELVSAPNWSSASARVNSFMFDAGLQRLVGIARIERVVARERDDHDSPCAVAYARLHQLVEIAHQLECAFGALEVDGAGRARLTARSPARAMLGVVRGLANRRGGRFPLGCVNFDGGSEHSNERQGRYRMRENRRGEPQPEFR